MEEINFAGISQEIMGAVMSHLIEAGISISCMESCTSGLFASAITDTEGASAVFKGSFVTYSNEMKVKCGVPQTTIDKYGVYSIETAEAMARACRVYFGADIGVGITGTTANVDPENEDSTPGEVFVCIRTKDKIYSGGITVDTAGLTRHEIKEQIICNVAQNLFEFLEL
ncbi:MAG: CinA family protein [Clostridiales bacterium]|nr:CinA family protein [Clostridiales bacterium]